MATPWERLQQRARNPYASSASKNSGTFKGRSLAAAKINEYRSPSPLGSTINVNVDPEIEEQKRKEAQKEQERRMRGLLSGPAALFPNLRDFKEGDGLKLGVETTSSPNENKFGLSTPFKYAYQKAVAPTLQGWQSLTETTAGLVATPFSSELQSAKNRGISAGDRWRELDLPTARIGKEKGEGIGFDVGVKGAVELLVDPVGWAMTVLPVGLAFRTAAYPAKKLGAIVGKLSGVTKASQKGKFIYEDAVIAADDLIKAQDDNATKDILFDLYERNTLGPSKEFFNFRNSGLGSLEDTPIIAKAHSNMNTLMNYDEIMGAKDQIGYTDGLIAYINSRATDSAKKKSGVFFRAINNPIQKFRPSVAKRMTVEGRVETYYNQYISAIPTEAAIQKGKFTLFKNNKGEETSFDDLFNAKSETLEMDVDVFAGTSKTGELPPQPRRASQKYATFKISSETIPMNIFDDSAETISSKSHEFIKNIEEATGMPADAKIRVEVNVDEGVVNLTTTQGYSIGKFDISPDIVNGTTNDAFKYKGKVLSGEGQDKYRKLINGIIEQQNKKYDAVKAKGTKRQDGTGNYVDVNTATFEFTPTNTIIWDLPSNFNKRKQDASGLYANKVVGGEIKPQDITTGADTLGGTLRENLAEGLDEIINRIKKTKNVTPAQKAKFTGRETSAYLKLTQTQIKDAQTLYARTVNNHFDAATREINNAKSIKDLKKYNGKFESKTIGQEASISNPKQIILNNKTKLQDAKNQLQEKINTLRTSFDTADQVQFTTLSDALLNLRNLDEGLRAGQLRVNKTVTRRRGGKAPDIEAILDRTELKGVTREIIRQYGKQNKNIDVLARIDDIDDLNPFVNTFYTKAEAFDGQMVFKDFEKMFGKNSSRVGKKSVAEIRGKAFAAEASEEAKQDFKDLQKEFKNLYKMGMDDVSKLETKMPVLQFLDMAGFVVGHSHSTGKPIRLFDVGYFDLNNDQIRYLNSFYDVFDRGAQILREEGALKAFDDVALFKTNNYVHHLVEEWGDATLEMQVTDDVLKGNRISGKLSDQAFQKKRAFVDAISEGFEQYGIQYLDDPANIVETFVKGMHEAVANAQLTRKVKVAAARDIKAMGVSQKAFEVATKAETLARAIGTFNPENEANVKKFIKGAYGKNGEEVQALISEINDGLNTQLKNAANGIDETDGLEITNLISRIGKDEIDNLVEDITNRKRVIDKKRQQETEVIKTGKFTIETSEELGRGIFGREKKATKARRITRYNGSKDGVNISSLDELFFDEKIAKSIEDTLGISEPGAFDRFADASSKIGDTIRLFQTAIDVGTPFLQGLPTLVTNPVVWGKATGNMYKTIFSPSKGGTKMRAQFYSENADTLRRMNRSGINMAGQGNDYFRALEKGGTADFLKGKGFGTETLPNKIGTTFDKGVGRFQDGFEHFGDQLRVSLFKAHEDQIIQGLGREARVLYQTTGFLEGDAKKNMLELGEYVNQMTGAFSHTQNMISRRQANMERAFLLFSPSYTRASLGLMGSVLSGGLKGDLAHKAMRNMLSAGVTMHYAQAAVQSEATGKPIEEYLNLDPSKSSFLTTDIRGVKVGVGSFWNSSAKVMARIVADPAFRGDVLDSPLLMTGAGRGQSGFDESGIKTKIANNPVVQWLRGRSSPVGSQFWNLGMGANYLGEELSPVSIDYFQEIGTNAFPFWFQNFFDAGLANGATSLLPEFAGLRSYEIPPWERRTEIRNDFAMRTYDELWNDLNDAQKANIEITFEQHPSMQRLRELDAEIKEKRRVVGGGEMDNLIDDYHADQDGIQAGYDMAIKDIVNIYNTRAEDEQGVILSTPSDLIKQEKLIRAQKNSGLKLLDDPNVNPQYQKVKAYYDSFNDFDKTEKPEDHFTEKYSDIYFSPKWDRISYYDFQGRDNELKDLVKSWGGDGQVLEDYAKGILFGRKMAVDPIVQEYYIGQNKYFDLYYKGAHDAIFTGKYGGEFDDMYERWRTSGTRDQELILEKNKKFARAFREISAIRTSMREIDQGLDAFLYRFRVGGIKNLSHRDNRDREDELNQLMHMETYVQ